MRFVALALALFSLGLQAEQFYPDKIGQWKIVTDYGGAASFALASSDVRAFTEKLDRLAEVLQAQPVLNPPRGFEARAHAEIFVPSLGCSPLPCSRVPAMGRIEVIFYYYFESNGKPAWGGEVNTSFDAGINDPEQALVGQGLYYEGLTDLAGHHLYITPAKTGEVHGFPIYNNEILVVSKSAKPYWLPVTREQYLRAVIKREEDRFAEMKASAAKMAQDLEQQQKALERAIEQLQKSDPKGAADMRRTIAQARAAAQGGAKSWGDNLPVLRAELDAMTPADRAAQAWFSKQPLLPMSGLVPSGSKDGVPLVFVNQDFLDRTRSRIDLQILVVRFLWSGHRDDAASVAVDMNPGVTRLWQMLQTTRWDQIADLLN